MRFLSRVRHTFTITGRGCVIVPEISRFEFPYRVSVQDAIQLRKPDGQIVSTHIAGMELFTGLGVEDRVGFLLMDIAKPDVPGGTEIWLSTREENLL